jgi:hypothetical protein
MRNRYRAENSPKVLSNSVSSQALVSRQPACGTFAAKQQYFAG